MKNIKKLSLITLLSASAVLTVACSQGAGSNSATQQTETKKEEKKTASEILNAAVENLKNEKSYEVSAEKTGIDGLTEHSTKTHEKTTAIVNKEAKIAKEFTETKRLDKGKTSSVEQWYTESENYRLINSSTGSMWWKSKINTESKEFYTSRHVFPLIRIAKYNKDLNLTEDSTSYTIDFTPNDLKDFVGEKNANTAVLEKYSVKVKIEKNNFRILTVEVTEKGKIKLEQTEMVADYTEKAEFKNYGNLVPLTLPEAAKSAREA